MARVYYREEKLIGKSAAFLKVTIDDFDYILKNASIKRVNITSKLFLGLFNLEKQLFKHILILDDGFYYDTSEGNFYLPKSIVFFNIDDYSFPTEYFFIAKIKDQLELRKVNGGKGIKWYQTVDLSVKVSQNEMLSKIENTLLKVKNLVKTKFNKQTDVIKQKKLEVKQIKPLISELQRNSYIELAKLCLTKNTQNDLINFWNTLKNYDNDDNYFTTLNFILEYLDKNEVYFIMSLDWKSGVEDLEWRVKTALKNNFNLSLNLPSENDYEKETSISKNGIFEDYNKILNIKKLQLGFIDTQSDEYVVIIHKMMDKSKVEQLVNVIGYNYYEK